MGVKEASFEWSCDWCRTTTTTVVKDLPEPWVLAEANCLYQFEIRHLCSEACWRNARQADILANELVKHVLRMVKRRWDGKDIVDIPDPAHVDLAFVIDGKVIREE
jgi:hypothetical protein